MIARVLEIFSRGAYFVRTNSKMLLVAFLIFVLPLLFLITTNSFLTSAQDNIESLEQKTAGALNDIFASTIEKYPYDDNLIRGIIDDLVAYNDTITSVKVLREDVNGFMIVHDSDQSKIGTYFKPNKHVSLLGFTDERDYNLFKFYVQNTRIWQTFRRVSLGEETLYIFVEQNFASRDAAVAARKNSSYITLTLVFIFLMGLAYWVKKQNDWERESRFLKNQLKERDLFSNMIAHEFRSPLTAIKGYASFLEESQTLTKEELRFSGNIRNAAERLVLLVNDFLEVARIQSGKMKISNEEFDLRETLKSVTSDLKVLAEEKGLTLTYADTSKPVLIKCDPARMVQVITNIVTNAIKYTDKGNVELECTDGPGLDEVTVRVKDTGMGISADDQKKLFAPFTRVGGVDGGTETGTGLGMWITKQLVALLGGRIGVESIKGVGTHIVITFKMKD